MKINDEKTTNNDNKTKLYIIKSIISSIYLCYYIDIFYLKLKTNNCMSICWWNDLLKIKEEFLLDKIELDQCISKNILLIFIFIIYRSNKQNFINHSW